MLSTALSRRSNLRSFSSSSKTVSCTGQSDGEKSDTPMVIERSGFSKLQHSLRSDIPADRIWREMSVGRESDFWWLNVLRSVSLALIQTVPAFNRYTYSARILCRPACTVLFYRPPGYAYPAAALSRCLCFL